MGDRAFTVAEIKSSRGGLQPDVDWYIRNQLLPTLGRLVAPLDDIPRGSLSDCLGVESSGFVEGEGRSELELTSSFGPIKEVGVRRRNEE